MVNAKKVTSRFNSQKIINFKPLMQAWEEFLKHQEKLLGKATVDRWLRTLRVVKFDARNLYLEAEDPLHKEWFEEHLRAKVKSGFYNNNNQSIRVYIDCPNKSVVGGEERTKKPLPYSIDAAPLDEGHTFENLVVVEENKIPCQLLLHILEQKNALFNPIYLFGPSGTGKTHLLTALTLSYQKWVKPVFMSMAKPFTRHVIAAMRLSMMKQFRDLYRNVDVLILDDVDELAKKMATQEEFFHTFNTLHTLSKQIILSGKKAPNQLQEIEQRLISRFSWGIELVLERYKEDSLMKILEKKASRLNLSLSPDVIKFFIETFSSNLSSHTQALEALSLRYREKKTPSLVSVKFLLKDLLIKEEATKLSAEKIVEATASFFGLFSNDLLGKSQAQEHAFPRQIALYLCRQILHMPFAKIGAFFNKDHSTVMSSIKKIEKQLNENHEKSCFSISKITEKLYF